MPSDPVLVAEDVKRHFGGCLAVDGVSLQVERGTFPALIGPNGAGKTTLFQCLAGALPATSGRILLEGRDVTRLPAFARARRGLSRTFQIAKPLPRLTVEENVRLAAPAQLGERWWAPLLARHRVEAQEQALAQKVEEWLRFFDLWELRGEFAGALSGGQKKLLELARCLMTEPRVVLLDEPLAGVNPTLALKILEKVEALRRGRGITFLLVEHDMEAVFRHCDPILVMANGRLLAQGSADEIRANPAVIDAYLGA